MTLLMAPVPELDHDESDNVQALTQALPLPAYLPIPKNLDDEALFARVARGDEVAFTILVDRHLSKVLSLATRMLGNPAEADDVAQEALLRVWTRGSLWRPGTAKFTTWLHRVTMNLCIDRLRRRTFQTIETVADYADASQNPEADFEQSQLQGHLTAALDALPGKQRAAIVLCLHEGHTGKEAAAILGLSVLAVQSLLVRARASLKQSLAAYSRALQESDHG